MTLRIPFRRFTKSVRRDQSHPLGLTRLEDRTVPSFAAPVAYPAGAAPDQVITADFNSDGKVDLAVLNGSGASVSVLLGNGNGTFQSPLSAINSGIPYVPSYLVVGDCDGDGHPDLVTSRPLAVGPDGGPSLSVLFGIGDGTFQSAMTVNVPAGAWGYDELSFAIAAGDINRDGFCDIVAVNGDYGSGNGEIVSLLGHNDRSFSVVGGSYVWYVNGGPALQLADFNEDGNLDILGFGTWTALGSGNGAFGPMQWRGSQWSGTVADFNNDGHADFSSPTGTGVNVWFGSGTGGFGNTATVTTGVSEGNNAQGDFNNDGAVDMIALNGQPGVTVVLGKLLTLA